MNDRKPTPKQLMRHRLVAAWRGVADGPVITLPTLNVADLAPKIVAAAGLADRVKLEDVLDAWKDIVGDLLFKLTRPDSMERGILTVRLTQPSAHHALMLEKPKILKRLQTQLPKAKIRDIRFRHG
ncbi:MAG: DciA family protein [Verrucomicrobiaceae bacterium]